MQLFHSQLELAGKAWRRAKPHAKALPRQFAPRHPVTIEHEYGRDIARVALEPIERWLKLLVIPRLHMFVGEHARGRPAGMKRDDDADDIDDLFNRIAILTEEQWTDAELKYLAKKRGQDVSGWNRDTIARNTFKVIGINPLFGDANLQKELSVFAVQNVNLIKSLRAETLKKLESQVLRDLQLGTRAETIAETLLQQINPDVSNARARANLIARDQVAKLNGQLTQLRQTDIGVTRYRWRTMGDARVRDSHQELNGQIFSWDDPPEPGHPGEDYQCRCYAEPVLEDLVPGMEAPEF